MADKPQVWTLSGLSTELKRDRRTLGKQLSNLQPDGKDPSGKYDVYLMSRVFNHLFSQAATGSSTGQMLDGTLERARKDKEQADKLALENEVTRGNLVKVEDVSRVWAEMASELRTKLLSIPTKTAPMVLGKSVTQIEERLQDEIYAALESVTDDRAGVSGHTETAAPTHYQ